MPLPLRYNVRNVLVRRWTSVFTAGGIALVVAVTMLVATGEPENLIVLRKGSTNDGSSFLPREAAQVVRQLAGVARAPDGEPLASAEIVNQPFLRTREGRRENVLVRGVEPVALLVHRSVHLVAGRMFRPNLGEV